MRITIDTEKEIIILPNSFFSNLEKQNKILADNGVDKKITPEDYVKENFEKAMKNPFVKQSDAKNYQKY